MKIKRIIEDNPILCPIKRITFPKEQFYEVGMNIAGKKITKILPYEENGEMASIIWFAIYADEEIICRANSRHIDTVQYY